MIVAVAIRQDGVIYTWPKPARHHDVIAYMASDCGLPTPIRGEQGFIAAGYGFVDRVQAKAIARGCGQILDGQGLLDELFSEDLW